MTSNVLYLILGVFDASAVFVLALRLHRQTVLVRHRTIILGSITIALLSYLFRIVLNVPLIDLPVQVIIFSLFLRYGAEYKFHWSLLMIVTAIGAYLPLQLIIALIMVKTGAITNVVISEAEGWGVSSIQVISIILLYLIGAIIHYAGLGFSFILQAPHDFNIKDNILSKANRNLLFAVIAVMAVISMTLITIVHLVTLWILPFALVAFICLYYFSNRRDYSID